MKNEKIGILMGFPLYSQGIPIVFPRDSHSISMFIKVPTLDIASLFSEEVAATKKLWREILCRIGFVPFVEFVLRAIAHNINVY